MFFFLSICSTYSKKCTLPNVHILDPGRSLALLPACRAAVSLVLPLCFRVSLVDHWKHSIFIFPLSTFLTRPEQRRTRTPPRNRFETLSFQSYLHGPPINWAAHGGEVHPGKNDYAK